MYYANASPRQTLFFKGLGARSRRWRMGERCQRTLFFVEIEARRRRGLVRIIVDACARERSEKEGIIIDDARYTTRKIEEKYIRDKQAREAR